MIEMSPLTLQCQSCSGSLGALLSALTQENGSDGRKGCLFNVSRAQMEGSRQGIHLQSRLSSQSLGRALKALGRNGESQNTRRKRKPTRIRCDTNRWVFAARPPQSAGSCWRICCISLFPHQHIFFRCSNWFWGFLFRSTCRNGFRQPMPETQSLLQFHQQATALTGIWDPKPSKAHRLCLRTDSHCLKRETELSAADLK